MNGLSHLPPCRRMMVVALLLWVVGGGLFLAGVRRGADFAIGAALVLVVVAAVPIPALRRAKPPANARLPGKG